LEEELAAEEAEE